MSNTLVLPNVTMEDRGMYRCRAELEPQRYKNSTAKVVIFGEFPVAAAAPRLPVTDLNGLSMSLVPEHPFLNISYKNEHLKTVTVREGKEGGKKLVFEPRVQALPPAVVLGW